MSILTGPEIQKNIDEGRIRVNPYNADNVGANSLDLCIGNSLKYYVDDDGRPLDYMWHETKLRFWKCLKGGDDQAIARHLERSGAYLDARKAPKTKAVEVPEDGLILLPGRGYLAATVESVGTDDFVPILHGRSSIGRLFLSVHHTAGFGDLGFEGTWTLEVTVEHPIKIYPDTRVCQVSFDTYIGEKKLYQDRNGSKYQNQVEPGESQLHRDFE